MENLKNVIMLLVIIGFASLQSCNEDEETMPLVNNQNPYNKIAFDDNQNVWFGTNNGLFVYKGADVEKVDISFKTDTINSIMIDNDELWIATDSGLYVFDIDSKPPVETRFFNKSNSDLGSDAVKFVGKDFLGNIWCGLGNGIAMFDGEAWKRNRNITVNLVNVSGFAVTQVAFGPVDYYCTTNGKYIFRIEIDETDGITGASQMIGGDPKGDYNFNGKYTTDTIFCAYVSRDSSVWFGSEIGLTRNKGKNKQGVEGTLFEYFLENYRTYSVMEKSNGEIWVGTNNGLHIKSSTSWASYSTVDGLPGNTVISIAESKYGTMWILTPEGAASISGSQIVTFAF